MATPTNRADFKAYCLRKLGAPVLEINVDDDQVEDRIDEALKLWHDYHFDGVDKTYFIYQLTPTDFANKYVTMPNNVIGVINIFPPSTYYGINSMFNVQYQMALNDMYTFTTTSIVPYYMAVEHMQFLEQVLVGQVPMRYNRKGNLAYLDMNWNRYTPGQYVIFECYSIVDETTVASVWGDYWLSEYTTALIKLQWGNNLSKFIGINLPGGVQFNGQAIKEEAMQEIKDLREELMSHWSEPPTYFIG